jgi:hypothetical protein
MLVAKNRRKLTAALFPVYAQQLGLRVSHIENIICWKEAEEFA